MSLDLQMLPNVISTVSLIVFLIGRLLVNKNLKLHIYMMSSAMVVDILLVLSLVIFRNALGTVLSGNLNWLLVVHILIAVSTIIGYGFAFYFGLQLKKGNRSFLKPMKTIDPYILSLRILTSHTSWLLMMM
jgi:hypothetical protein